MMPDSADQAILTDDTDREDRSMQVIEYVIAFVSLAVAGILAIAR